MERLEPIRFNYKEYTVNYLKTKYSKYFDDARKMGGATYFNEGRVTIISESEESLEAKVNGTSVYDVKVNFLKKGKIETICECPYYNETSHYCKHIYASLLASEMIKKREFIKNAYLKNIDILKDIMNKTNNIKLEYADKYPKCISFIDPVINDMKRELDIILIDAGNAKDYVLSANTVRSFSKVNMFIKDYNYLVDEMESFIDEFNKKIKEDKKRKLREEKKKIRDRKLEEFRKENNGDFAYDLDNFKEKKGITLDENDSSIMVDKSTGNSFNEENLSQKDIKVNNNTLSHNYSMQKSNEYDKSLSGQLERQGTKILKEAESKKNRITFGDILRGFFFASAIEDHKKKKKDDLFSFNEEDFDDEVVDEDDYYHDDLD